MALRRFEAILRFVGRTKELQAIALYLDLGTRELRPGALQYMTDPNVSAYLHDFRDYLVREYTVLTFLEESFAERLRRLRSPN